jgi:coproporphyrinogen III oxidase
MGGKLILTSKYNQNNNFVVYHQNIKGISDKTDQLLMFINNTHSFCSIYCYIEDHRKAPEHRMLHCNEQDIECCTVQRELKFS